MDLRQTATLKRKLTLLGRTRPQLAFLYTPAGPDGAPVLLADTRLDPGAVLALSRDARSRDLVRGSIARDLDTGLLEFTVASGSAEGLTRFVGHLEGMLAELVPSLAGARVRAAN